MICRLHADRDIRDGVVDLFLCAGEGLIRVDDGAVALVRGKVAVAVMGDEAPQPLAEIKESILGPQVHQAVAAGGPCQSDNAPDAGTHLQQGAEAFCLITLEAGQLVDDHHVVVKGQVALLDQPLHVLPVDDVHGSVLHQGGFPLQLRSDRHREGQAPEMIPFADLRWPCVPRHTERGDYQHLADQEAVETQVEDGGQRDDALAKAHIQQYSGNRVRQDEIGGVGLIVMRTVFH